MKQVVQKTCTSVENLVECCLLRKLLDYWIENKASKNFVIEIPFEKMWKV
jgi:hypothetical protein